MRISSATTSTNKSSRSASTTLSAKYSNGNSKVFSTNGLSLNKSRDSVATFSISAGGSGTKKGLYQFVERVNAPQMKDDLIPFRVGMTVKVGVTVTDVAFGAAVQSLQQLLSFAFLNWLLVKHSRGRSRWQWLQMRSAITQKETLTTATFANY